MGTINVKIYVSDITNVLSNFDHLQMQRSKAGSPYVDSEFVTDVAATYPVIVGTNEGPFASLNGKTLLVKVNGGAEQDVTFQAADPISLNNVIDEINTALSGVTADNDGTGKLELTGDLLGTGGTLEITGGTSLAILGLSQEKVNGLDAHVALQAGVSVYEYTDLSGEATYWYRSRYYNETLDTYGGWSDWIQGSVGTVVDAANLIIGRVKMTHIDGSALSGAKITIVNVYNPLIVDDYFVAGSSRQIVTDGTGQAEITLIKGSTLDIVLEGTSIIRRILVPTTGTDFDLLDPSLQQDDPFNIQVPDLPAAVRRS